MISLKSHLPLFACILFYFFFIETPGALLCVYVCSTFLFDGVTLKGFAYDHIFG
jgi:hypothetical protein